MTVASDSIYVAIAEAYIIAIICNSYRQGSQFLSETHALQQSNATVE